MKRISVYRVQLMKVETLQVEESTIRNPDTAADITRSFLRLMYGEGLPDRELVGVMYLNTKNRVTGIELISIGTIDSSLLTMREAFKGAILHNAHSIIAFHNHPSGIPTPSKEDIEVSKRLIQTGELLGIEFLDHIVLGERKYVSLKQDGLI